MYIIYAVRRIGFFLWNIIVTSSEESETTKKGSNRQKKIKELESSNVWFLFYLLNRKTGLGILDFKGLVSPVAAATVTGAGITGNALLLLPPVAVALGFFLSPHSDSHFCFSEENSSTFVSVLLLLSGCCCCCATTLFDFFGDRPECCDWVRR